MRKIRKHPIGKCRAELRRNFCKAQAAALTVFLNPLDDAAAFEPLIAVQGECKWHDAVRSHWAHRTKTKSFIGNAEQHSAVAAAELKVNELFRFFMREIPVSHVHKESSVRPILPRNELRNSHNEQPKTTFDRKFSAYSLHDGILFLEIRKVLP